MSASGEHTGNLLKEGERPERLGQHRTRDLSTLSNTRDEQHRRWSLEGGEVGGEIQAVHLRQKDVRYDKGERPLQAVREGEGLLPIFRCEDRVALIGQRLRQDAAEYGVVLDKQDYVLTGLLRTHWLFRTHPTVTECSHQGLCWGSISTDRLTLAVRHVTSLAPASDPAQARC
jgi:hypothetical protein